MKKDIVQKWVDALRSGDYRQTRGRLQRTVAKSDDVVYGSSEPGFCCLGVLCEIAVADGVIENLGPDSDGDIQYGAAGSRSTVGPTIDIYDWLDETGGELGRLNLVSLNDDEGYSFEQIAEVLETEILNA